MQSVPLGPVFPGDHPPGPRGAGGKEAHCGKHVRRKYDPVPRKRRRSADLQPFGPYPFPKQQFAGQAPVGPGGPFAERCAPRFPGRRPDRGRPRRPPPWLPIPAVRPAGALRHGALGRQIDDHCIPRRADDGAHPFPAGRRTAQPGDQQQPGHYVRRTGLLAAAPERPRPAGLGCHQPGLIPADPPVPEPAGLRPGGKRPAGTADPGP